MGTRLLLSAATAAAVEGRKLKQEDLGERVVFRHSDVILMPTSNRGR